MLWEFVPVDLHFGEIALSLEHVSSFGERNQKPNLFVEKVPKRIQERDCFVLNWILSFAGRYSLQFVQHYHGTQRVSDDENVWLLIFFAVELLDHQSLEGHLIFCEFID